MTVMAMTICLRQPLRDWTLRVLFNVGTLASTTGLSFYPLDLITFHSKPGVEDLDIALYEPLVA